MSLILKALQKTQQRYAASAKPSTTNNPSVDAVEEAIEPVDAAVPFRKNRIAFNLRLINILLSIILAISIAAILVLLNERITSQVNLANDKISNISKHLKSQEEQLTRLTDAIEKLATTSAAQTSEVRSDLVTLKNAVSTLNKDFKDQKAVLAASMEETIKGVAKLTLGNDENIKLLKFYRQDLKDQIELITSQLNTIKTQAH